MRYLKLTITGCIKNLRCQSHLLKAVLLISLQPVKENSQQAEYTQKKGSKQENPTPTSPASNKNKLNEQINVEA
jgi:hypothetical protein